MRLPFSPSAAAALAIALSLFSPLPARAAARHTFEIGAEAFLLDGKPFVIRTGEMHFARVPR